MVGKEVILEALRKVVKKEEKEESMVKVVEELRRGSANGVS